MDLETKKGAKEQEDISTIARGSAWKRVPVYFSYEEYRGLEARMRLEGKTKIGPYLKETEQQKAQITDFKKQKAQELAYELKRWAISLQMVEESYKRL